MNCDFGGLRERDFVRERESGVWGRQSWHEIEIEKERERGEESNLDHVFKVKSISIIE